MGTYKPVPVAPFLKGCMASTDPYTQPKGSFPRGSNFLLNKRGALDTCDGTQVVHAFNGAVQGPLVVKQIMATFLFSPTGVARYYLMLAKMTSLQGLGLRAVQNLVATLVAGGTLTSGTTYVYKVTALDGAGGETDTAVEVNATPAGGNLSVKLTWNVVPNAVSYNVYRGQTGSGSEILLIGTGLPVPQVTPGTLSVTFTDTGVASTAAIPISTATHNLSGNVAIITTTVPHGLAVNQLVGISGVSFAGYNTGSPFVVASVISPTQFTYNAPFQTFPFTQNGVGGTATGQPPPVSDSTQQTVLFQMPPLVGIPASLPVSYNKANIVALYPADPIVNVDGGGGGGSGGGGGGGGGGTGGGSGGGSSPTPSGGVPGNLSPIPQLVQFTNRVAMALGNGFPPQLFSDATGTLVNPATIAAIASISVDAFGVVTVTTSVPHGLSAAQVGANVVIAGVTNAAYNTNGSGVSAFVTIAVTSATVYQIRNLNAVGQAASSGGTSTTTSVPITSSFVPAFPTWSATTAYSVNSIVQPSPTNGHFYKAIQGGTSGGVQPVFPTGTGQQINDGSIIWQEAGLTNTAAPPPPGAAHVFVHAGSLFWWNTSPTNTSTGLDGPCSLRMSDVNNPTSYNPLNQAFLDKDDGTEGMGLQSFTISAQGIPPEGSLVIFKNFAAFQMIGVFGSPQLTIQRIRSTMGCLAPRSIQFVPGYGIFRFAHLGFASFDGVEDKVMSEEMRPFLFPSNASEDADITVMDAANQTLMWCFQTAQPAMFCAAIPIGNSQGKLTRILSFDLVLKSWAAPVDLPWPISTAAQFLTFTANPVTILGGFQDGVLSRWQATDAQWDVGATGARSPSNINWSVKLPEGVSQVANQKLNCRRVAIRGISSGSGAGKLNVVPVVNGVNKPSQPYTIPASGDWEVFASFMRDGLRFSAILSGSGQVELNREIYHITAKEIGAAQVIA